MGTVPLPTWAGQTQALKGDFMIAKHLRSKSAYHLERMIGFRSGRLRDGWWLMLLTVMPTIDQFEFRGYTHMSGGKIEGHLPQSAGGMAAEGRLKAEEVDVLKLKHKAIAEQFSIKGADRIAKVRPAAAEHRNPGIPDYPQGDGIPQWTLIQPLFWKAAAFIPPGHVYLGNYT